MLQLLEKFQEVNSRFNLLKKGDGVVVGLSGGPDSTALLLLLVSIQKKYSLQLAAAHINHNLSISQSLQFERFSEGLAKQVGVPFFKKKVYLGKLAKKNKKTLEEMGRIIRYDFFKEVAHKTGFKKIATAHTLDDQAETILMRLGRGAGLKGLAGIPVKRAEGECVLVRPLIHATKKNILLFLKNTKQGYCHDLSNTSLDFTRNRVRNKLVPWLSKNLNPQIGQSLADMGEICGQAHSFIEKHALTALKQSLISKNSKIVLLDARKLASLHPAVQAEVIFMALTTLKGGRQRFGISHIAAVQRILNSHESALEVHLPGFLVARKEKGLLRIFDRPSK